MMSDLVLAKIEQIEALHEREREIYAEIKAMGEMVYDNAWDKLAREVVESRAAARSATEDAAANLASFNWMFEPDPEVGEPPVEITPERLWRDVAPKLRELFAEDKKALQMVEQIDRLSVAKAEA